MNNKELKKESTIEIFDKREQKEFSGISFSQFKKTDVKKQLLNSILNGKIEDALYWSAELICAGHFLDLWEIIFLIISKYIYISNPKLPIYIDMKTQQFKDILINGYLDNELKLRNNIKIRQIFGELVCLLTFSRKNNCYSPIKINKNEFIMTEISFRLKADNLDYSKNIFKSDDPKELFIAINEFCYNISNKQRNNSLACYWLEWILEFEAYCKRNKDNCIACKRNFVTNIINEKYHTDIIWIIWDALFYECRLRTSPLLLKIIKSLFNIFSLHYSFAIKKRRKYILYFIIQLLTEDINITKPITDNSNKIQSIVLNIDNIYKKVKQNEIQPEESYLFSGLKQSNNFEKSLTKLEKMNVNFIPRI